MLDRIGRVEGNPFLATRLRAKLAACADGSAAENPIFNWKWALAALLILVNGWTLLHSPKTLMGRNRGNSALLESVAGCLQIHNA